MDLKTHISNMTVEDRDLFAEKCGTSRGHLQNVAYGYRTCAPALAVAIEKASDRVVTRKSLCPNDWHRIWPELIGIDGSPATTPQPEGVANV